MNIDQKLDLLKKIQKVDAPPFLLTRIRQRIESTDQAMASTTWKVAYGGILMVMLALNVSVFFVRTDQASSTQVQEIVSVMELSSQNDFYNE